MKISLLLRFGILITWLKTIYFIVVFAQNPYIYCRCSRLKFQICCPTVEAFGYKLIHPIDAMQINVEGIHWHAYIDIYLVIYGTMVVIRYAAYVFNMLIVHFQRQCHRTFIIPSINEFEGVYWYQFVCPSVRRSVRLSTKSCPLSVFHNTDEINYLFTHLINQLPKMCHVWVF